jgi:hypothetical protein
MDSGVVFPRSGSTSANVARHLESGYPSVSHSGSARPSPTAGSTRSGPASLDAARCLHEIEVGTKLGKFSCGRAEDRDVQSEVPHQTTLYHPSAVS